MKLLDIILISWLITSGLSYGMLTIITKIYNKHIVRKDYVMVIIIYTYGIFTIPTLYYKWPSEYLTIPLVIVMIFAIWLKQFPTISKWLEKEV